MDLAAAAEAVSRITEVSAAASAPEVMAGVGGFAGLIDLGEGRLLAAATDGVGTKIDVACLAERFDTVGIDLVAMSANDVVCTGARPLFFLDYVAVENLVPDQVTAIVGGVAEGCRRAGCALLGGETAEHPGTMLAGSFDLAGFCVGLVERDRLFDRNQVRPGDSLVGFPSTGLHANGFSLVRRVLRPTREFLEPTAIYVQALLALSEAGLVRSAAHITGGGFHENVPRALPEELGADIDTTAWTPPPVFNLVAEAAEVELMDLASVLNLGIGMVVVVPGGREEEVLAAVSASGPILLGEVTGSPGVRFAGTS